MLRDASQKQVIQKFSFIESLDIPQETDRKNPPTLEEVDVEQAFNFVPQTSSKSSSTISKEDSALIAAVETANSHLAVNNSYPGIGEIIKYSELNYPANNYAPKNPNYLGKILFALSCSYCLFVLWWLFGNWGSKFMTEMMGGKYITLSQSEVEFIDRIERSLLSLDRELEAKKSDLKDKNQIVYVPVYTPKDRTPATSAPVVVAQPKPTPVISSPTPQALKIPAPPPLPAPAPIENSAPSQAQDTPAVAAKPAVKHTLTGILELGAGKSAALIKVNGQTRRFWLGEEINNSGWILESIGNQTAKISDRGQVRSIAVGESF